MDDRNTADAGRPSKRRKIYRKRLADEDEGHDSNRSPDAPDRPTQSLSHEHAAAEPIESRADIVRRPVSRKHGVGFSTAAATRPTAAAEEITEKALVPVRTSDESQDLPQINRFVKPTGKIDAAEDKHLTAYVDSKLADLRARETLQAQQQASLPETQFPSDTPPSHPSHSPSHTHAANQPLSTLATNPRTSKPHRRRQPAAREPSALARDALVDEILHETQVPKFDLRKHLAPRPHISADADNNDEAVAEAFKAQFLVHLNERNRRRQAASSANPKPATVSHGPKLGGSRAQRGKMRAQAREDAAAAAAGTAGAKP